ncbi:MAG TPA: AraC family transcriptional regulator [Povalibacter sp.]
MLLRSMPDLSPGNTAFRQWFYSRWGQENCVILGRSRRAEYATFQQRLSIKMALGGAERYFVDGRSVAVDDDAYLMLNDGRRYGSLIASEREVESFSIFFRPGLVEDVRHAMTANDTVVLEGKPSIDTTIEFPERLHPHDSAVTPIMRFIRHYILAGVDDERWYEEQLQVLAERLLQQQHRIHGSGWNLDCVKASTRTELTRRLALAADFIQSNYDHDIGLQQMASAACLSVHHFMRLFRSVYGMTPTQFLYRKRIQTALRIQRGSTLTGQQISDRVGFNSRATFYRQLQRWQASVSTSFTTTAIM